MPVSRKIVMLCCLCLIANVSQAHHSFAAEFDADSLGELTGTITQVRFSNPHVRYRIAVDTGSGEPTIWELQASSVTSLRGLGWHSDTIKVGDSVSVSGQLGRNNSKKLFIRGGTLADGSAFGAVNRELAARVNPNEVRASADTDYGHGQINASHPFDISGAWRNSYKFHVTVDDFEPKPTPFTDAGRALYAAVQKYDDPGLRCISLGLPRVFGGPYNLDIYDAGDHYLFIHVQEGAVRRIWMDGRAMPAEARATSLGYSVGHWEDERTLVIETSHLLPGWLDGSGLPMSGDGTRTLERYHFSGDHLSADRSMTVDDPYYTTALIRTRGMAREDNLDVGEQDSCDPASYYLDLYEAGLMENYLQP